MQFFFHEIVARVVALYLCVDCFRKLRHGFAARKVESEDDDWLDWSRWSNLVVSRDAAPVSYWVTMGLLAGGLAACLVVAIFGWLPR